jgi:hypothetical protein
VELLAASLKSGADASAYDRVLLYPAGGRVDSAGTNRLHSRLQFEPMDVDGKVLKDTPEVERVLRVMEWIHLRGRDGEDQHLWYFLIDGANAVKHMPRVKSVHPWDKLATRIAQLTAHFNPAVPIYFGDHHFVKGDPGRTTPVYQMSTATGAAFPAPDSEDWLPVCTVDHLLLNTGGLDLLFGDPAHLPTCKPHTGLQAHNQTGADGTAAAILATCLEEVIGLRCRSLSSWLKRGDANDDVVDEWGPTWRHSAWNCSLPARVDLTTDSDINDVLPAHNSLTSVSAVCQAPLLVEPAPPNDKILASAPDWIGSLYEVVHAPVEIDPLVVAPAAAATDDVFQASSPPVATSWLMPKGKRGGASPNHLDASPLHMPRRVTYAPNELRDVVLAVGSGTTLNRAVIELFVHSLRSTGCRAEIVLFLDNRTAADYIELDARFGGVRIISIQTEILNQKFKYGKPSVLFRFALYLHYLDADVGADDPVAESVKPQTKPRTLYRTCLHADLFDTYFQRDPFAAVDIRGGLAVFAENTDIKIGHCSFHRYWYNGCQQAGRLLHSAHNQPRVCMGLVMAARNAFVMFLKMTLHWVMQKCNDQGVLNMLVHSGKYAAAMPVTMYTSRDGAVIHLNTDWHLTVAADGMIRNKVGEPFAVVHQWDRIGGMQGSSGQAGRLASALVGATAATLTQRENGLRTKWMGGPKHDWHTTGKVASSCVVVGATSHQDVVCHANTNAMSRKSPNVLFCPTHSAVVGLAAERIKRLPQLMDATESTVLTTTSNIRHVLASTFLSCTSDAIVAKCASQYWCTVTKKIVQAAIGACQMYLLDDQDALSMTSEVTYNVVFRCLLPKVASRHRHASSDAD